MPPKKKSSTGMYLAIGGLVVVGLYVYLRGKAKAAQPQQIPTPTSIAPALTGTASGPGQDSSGTSGDLTPQGDTSGSVEGATTGYQPFNTANSLAPLSIIPSGTTGFVPQGGVSTGGGGLPAGLLLNPGGFPTNPAGGYNPGGGLVLASGSHL